MIQEPGCSALVPEFQVVFKELMFTTRVVRVRLRGIPTTSWAVACCSTRNQKVYSVMRHSGIRVRK